MSRFIWLYYQRALVVSMPIVLPTVSMELVKLIAQK